jgi:hypothetical protein
VDEPRELIQAAEAVGALSKERADALRARYADK